LRRSRGVERDRPSKEPVTSERSDVSPPRQRALPPLESAVVYRRFLNMAKSVFFFGDGAAEGDPKKRDLLGGKGAGLAEMTSLGLPVPAGFTISTEVSAAYSKTGKWPQELEQ